MPKHKNAFSENELHVCAAILGRSNMGMSRPKSSDVASLKNSGSCTLNGAVMYLCQEFMETNEHQRMFESEAKWFVQQLKADPAKARKVWSDVFKLYAEA